MMRECVLKSTRGFIWGYQHVSCCALLPCAMLCSAALCSAMQCYAALYYAPLTRGIRPYAPCHKAREVGGSG
eukprot:SAG11_NODE_646_length_7961_cov_2.885907_7_plen_72_part_00